MKGLRKYLTPFAPDQSGAVSVLYELGGIIVICDAGGCTGNICGFDEPRWFTKRSAVFSAGLRDMDAILGRDDRLVAKLAKAANKLDASFAAIIGTPVPSVIGTDYQALRRLAEKKLNIPIITVDTNGMELSDRGAEKAYVSLIERFTADTLPVQKGRLGVLGASPLELSCADAGERLSEILTAEGWTEIFCYGMGAGLDELREASSNEKNLVVSPAGLKAAKLLQEKFGTPYEVRNPLAVLPEGNCAGKNVLIVQQQVSANSLRSQVLNAGAASVTCATWFMKKTELAEKGDLRLKEEDDFVELVRGGSFDVILGDRELLQMISFYQGEFINMPEFALSGRLAEYD